MELSDSVNGKISLQLERNRFISTDSSSISKIRFT